MENSEHILHQLERFKRLKMREIPTELDDYLRYVAITGDTIFSWSTVKHFYREKFLHVLKNFDGGAVNIQDIPSYPNVDPFNYDNMKNLMLSRLDSFNGAPFTIQRLSELLLEPRRQYNRIDKYMRALEKNILVVSTIPPGGTRRNQYENGDNELGVNGDLSADINIDVEGLHESMFSNREVANGQGRSDCDDDSQPLHKRFKEEYEEAEEAMETDDYTTINDNTLKCDADVGIEESIKPVLSEVETSESLTDELTTNNLDQTDTAKSPDTNEPAAEFEMQALEDIKSPEKNTESEPQNEQSEHQTEPLEGAEKNEIVDLTAANITAPIRAEDAQEPPEPSSSDKAEKITEELATA